MDEEEAAGKGESTDDEEETEEIRMLREEKEAADQKKEWADVMLEQEQAYSALFKWFLLLLFSKWFHLIGRFILYFFSSHKFIYYN